MKMKFMNYNVGLGIKASPFSPSVRGTSQTIPLFEGDLGGGNLKLYRFCP